MEIRSPLRPSKVKTDKYRFWLLGDERARQSKTPAMFNQVIKTLGLNASYDLKIVQPDELGQTLRTLKNLNISGAHITIPYKEKVIPFLDVLSEGAQIVGSINAIARDGESLKGYNTNAIGFIDALKEIGFDPADKSALVVGSGGAARAVVFILKWHRAKSIMIADPDNLKTQEISKHIGGVSVSLEDLQKNAVHANIVINATPASSADEYPDLEGLVNRAKIEHCELIVDLNVGRIQSVWKDLANDKGIHFMDGKTSLANQAKRTFAIWTGHQVDPKLFLDVIT